MQIVERLRLLLHLGSFVRRVLERVVELRCLVIGVKRLSRLASLAIGVAYHRECPGLNARFVCLPREFQSRVEVLESPGCIRLLSKVVSENHIGPRLTRNISKLPKKGKGRFQMTEYIFFASCLRC